MIANWEKGYKMSGHSSMYDVDEQVKLTLRDKVAALETRFVADVIFLFGPIYPSLEKRFRDFIDKLSGRTTSPA